MNLSWNKQLDAPEPSARSMRKGTLTRLFRACLRHGRVSQPPPFRLHIQPTRIRQPVIMAKVKASSSSKAAAASASSAAPKNKAPLQIASFTVFPITYAPVVSSQKKAAVHYLYIRPDAAASTSITQEGGDEEEGEKRTLFVANLPPDSTEAKLRALFSSVGAIEEVSFGARGKAAAEEEPEDEEDDDDSMYDHGTEDEAEDDAMDAPRSSKKPQSAAPAIEPLFATPLTHHLLAGSTARITYLSHLSLTRSLLLPQGKRPTWPTSDATSSIGLAHYLTTHATLRPPLPRVKAHADSSLAHHEFLQEQEKRRVLARGTDIVDEDGFTLVVRGGKYGKNLAGGGVGVASKRWDETKEEDVGRKKKSKELKDFYRWVVAQDAFLLSCVRRLTDTCFHSSPSGGRSAKPSARILPTSGKSSRPTRTRSRLSRTRDGSGPIRWSSLHANNQKDGRQT